MDEFTDEERIPFEKDGTFFEATDLSDEIDATLQEAEKERAKWLPASMSDGVIEILAVRGSLELAQVKLGLANCRKLAQGKCIYLQVPCLLSLISWRYNFVC